MPNGGIGELLFGRTHIPVTEKVNLLGDPPLSLFAPVKLFSSRFLNRRQRRVPNGGIGELLFGHTIPSIHEWQKRCAEPLRYLCLLL